MKFNGTRDEAIAIGKKLGTLEADSRGEIEDEREERIARAMAYAAWTFDGTPASSEEQRKEFGLSETSVAPSLSRAAQATTKPSKEKKK